jgi:hypothetical protein
MFTKHFELKLYVPATWEVSGDMPLRWRDNLKNAAQYLFDRLTAKIPDDGTFINRVATPASQAYRSLLNPAYISKSGRTADDISNSHATNMGRKFSQWLTNLTKAFATVDGVQAKVFKEKVDAAIDRWAIAVGDKSVRLTGDKIRGRSVAPIAAFYLVGDKRASGWIREEDLADGTPTNITSDLQRTALKAAVMQRLLQGGMMVINSGSNPAVIAKQNDINAELLTMLKDPTRCDAFVATPASDKCFCSWAVDGSFLYLHIQAGLTT